MTSQEALTIGKTAVEALVNAKGNEHAFPFDEIWSYTKAQVPSLSRPAIARKLERMGYIELTGGLTKAVTSARAGSPTREYRPGGHFRLGSQPPQKKARLWSPDELEQALTSAGISFREGLPQRLTAALLSKRFVILTGLSGAGKTKVAHAFASWLCEHDESGESEQYVVQAVGADWTNREPLLGYPDALSPGDYRMPPSGALQLVLRAMGTPDLPHFLILDEMNLSHVERYFADVLSAMETGQPIPLHEVRDYEGREWNQVPSEITLPPNLFVIGTVNVDETTYMFSPKVLDRAHVVEFTVTKSDISRFLGSPSSVDLARIAGKGTGYARDFVATSGAKLDLAAEPLEIVKKMLEGLFDELAEIGAEFGYRPAYEIARFVYFHAKLANEPWRIEEALDAAIMQKILPKLHGSKIKLQPVLDKLKPIVKDYPLSADKIRRMERRLKQNGFTSYAEA